MHYMLNDTSDQSLWRRVWPVLVLCTVSLFLFLGLTLFNTRGEPREAVVALSMLEQDNWILPVSNGVDIPYKPPFMHWIIAVLSFFFGGVTEYVSRMPSALAATAMTMATYLFFRRHDGREAGWLTAFVCLTTFEVHRAAMACRVDMVLTACIVMALYALYEWWKRELRGFPWMAVLLMAGAALTKGPVGALLPGFVFGVFLLLNPVPAQRKAGWGWHTLAVRTLSVGLRMLGLCLLSLVPLCVWYVLAYRQPGGGDAFLYLIYEENVLRLTGQMAYDSHVNPWHYNVMTLLAGLTPYTLLLPLALPLLWRRDGEDATARQSDGWCGRLSRLSPLLQFVVLSAGLIFLFYCIPASKRSVYLLPVYPFASYGLAKLMIRMSRRGHKALYAFGCVLSGLMVVLSVAFVAVRWGWLTPEFLGKTANAQFIAMWQALQSAEVGWRWLLWGLPLVVSVIFWGRGRRDALPRSVVALAFCTYMALDGLYQPLVLNVKSDKAEALRIQALQPEGTVYSYRPEDERKDARNLMHPFTINYYLNDRVKPLTSLPDGLPRNGLLITEASDADSLLARHPDFRLQRLFSKARSCDGRKPIHVFRFTREDGER